METVKRDKKTGLEYIYVQLLPTSVVLILWLLCLGGTLLGFYIADHIMFLSGLLSLGFVPILAQKDLVRISARKNLQEMLTKEFLADMNEKIRKNLDR